MPRAFFTLLLLNLAYFAWAHWIDKPPPPPVNESYARLPRLKLASEQPPEAPHGRGPDKTALNLPPAAAVPPPACLSVGPFADVDDAARAAAGLREKGFDPRQRAEPGETSLQYAVYVGGMKSDAEAQRMLQNLKRKGFGDALLSVDGADAGRRVSLGHFGERARADERAQAVRLQGFKAEVAERRLSATVYWLDFIPPAGVGSVPLEGLAEGAGSRIAVQPCPSSAPREGLPGGQLLTPVHERAIAGSPQAQIAATRSVP